MSPSQTGKRSIGFPVTSIPVDSHRNIDMATVPAFDRLLAPAFQLISIQTVNTDTNFNFAMSETMLSVSCRGMGVKVEIHQKWEREMRESEVTEACERVNRRGMPFHYGVQEGKEVRVVAWLAMPSLQTKDWEPLVQLLIDTMLRDSFLFLQTLKCDRLPLPLTPHPPHPFACSIWPLISYLEPDDYKLTCNSHGYGKFSANFPFTHNYTVISEQKVKVKTEKATGDLTVAVSHCASRVLTKEKMMELGLISKDVKLVKHRLTASIKLPNTEPLTLLNSLMHITQQYIYSLGRLMESGVTPGKLPFPAVQVLHKDHRDPHFALFVRDLDLLRPKLFDIPADFTTPMVPNRWCLESFREVWVGKRELFERIRQEYVSVRLGIRFILPQIRFNLLKFDANTGTIVTDLTGLTRISDIFPNTRDSLLLSAYIQQLLDIISQASISKYRVNRVKSTWYEYTDISKSVIIPDIDSMKWSVVGSEGGMREIEGLKEVGKVGCYLLPVTLENAKEVVRQLTRISGESCDFEVDMANLQLGTFQPRDSTISLYQLLTRLIWFYFKPLSVLQNVHYHLIQSTVQNSSILSLRRILDPTAFPFTQLPPEGKLTFIGELYIQLQKLQKDGIAVLLLRPESIFIINNKIEIREFVFNTKGLDQLMDQKKYADLRNLDYIDPAVISYLYWKSGGYYATEDIPKAKSKCIKFSRKISQKCDIFSFAMFIYSLIWPENSAFQYVLDLHNQAVFGFNEYFSEVVKLNRRPIIPVRFEERFPEATDVMRRSFMKTECRPELKDMELLVKEVTDLRKWVEENSSHR